MLYICNLKQFSTLIATWQHLKIGNYSFYHELLAGRVKFSSVKNGIVNHGLAKSGTLRESISFSLYLTYLIFNMALLLTIKKLCELYIIPSPRKNIFKNQGTNCINTDFTQ